ncbi:MAG TPA: rhomboid family intramembrane serine protease, partial [Thermoanaerobaculaceae bacterium]|nr:rhomboid family intramembrane serine protease [Thermoanaerobaculaceae bacterium]
IHDTAAEHPIMRLGLVPAHPTPVAFITSMFMHSGWMHLLGNLLIFYLAGPFIEDAFGRPLFAALYLASGLFAAGFHIAMFPHSTSPLVGASGAIAGIMGAFLIRFARTRVRFFYVLWLFLLVRWGTVTVPAWVVLPLWLLQNLFFAGLSSQSGVAYWAHVGGFGFGCAAALAIRQLKVEERYVAPAIEKEISVSQHAELDPAMEALSRGEVAAAREGFARVLAAEPRNPDAHLGMWQTYVHASDARGGAEHVVRVIEDELRRGEGTLALDHWRELVQAAGTGGPAALRWRLASVIEAQLPAAAAEIYRDLAADPTAGVLAEKAARRLGAPVGAAASAAGPQAAAAAAIRPVPPATVAAAPAAPAPDGCAPGFEVESCTPQRLQADGLLLVGNAGGPEILPFAQVGTVAVGAITGAQRPYLVLDLVLRPVPGERRKVVRLLSSGFDPRALVGGVGQTPIEAFRELIRVIVAATGARVAPDTLLSSGGRFASFATPEEYERALLAPLA